MSINKCALNFLLFLVACFTEDQQIWYHTLAKQTVLRRLRQARQPIRPRKPYVGQVLTARHRAARLQWAQRHFRWGRQQWAVGSGSIL